MKVEHNGPGISLTRSEEARPADAASAAASRSKQASAETDQLTLSADAQAVQSALDQVALQPEIRTELVNRMRQLLEQGELGRDAHRLADAIIDRWVTTPDRP